MKYTLNDKIFYKINKIGLGKVENYIATKRSPKYIEMVREEIKKIDPNNLEAVSYTHLTLPTIA